MRPRIAILSFSWLARDPRIQRQFAALLPDHDLVGIGFGPSGRPDVPAIELPLVARPLAAKAELLLRLAMRDHRTAYWSTRHFRAARAALRASRWDAIIANDIDALPAALAAANGSPVIFDAHEYAPCEQDDEAWWRLLIAPLRRQLCRHGIPRCQAMTTVSAGIAKAYSGLGGPAIRLVLNTPPFSGLQPTEVDPQRIRIVHHGAALRIRRLADLVRMGMRLEPRFTLEFMLVPGDPGHLDELRRLAAPFPRISFRPPVPLQDTVATLNAYDIGIHLLPSACFNNRHALPNKLFEFIQARIGVVVNPVPAMTRLVHDHAIGAIADSHDPAALADRINRTSVSEIIAWKSATGLAANEFCSERGMETIRSVVHDVLRTRPCAA